MFQVSLEYSTDMNTVEPLARDQIFCAGIPNFLIHVVLCHLRIQAVNVNAVYLLTYLHTYLLK